MDAGFVSQEGRRAVSDKRGEAERTIDQPWWSDLFEIAFRAMITAIED